MVCSLLTISNSMSMAIYESAKKNPAYQIDVLAHMYLHVSYGIYHGHEKLFSWQKFTVL